jgi:hypothetical protein
VLRSVARALRLRARVAVAYAVLAVLAAPAAFGSATGAVMHALGAATAEHVCKCGMPAGKCGCPECERLEQERRHEHQSLAIPALKSHCDDDAPPIQLGALPAAVPGAGATAVLPPERGERVSVRATLDHPHDLRLRPPTPPPRSAAA